MPLNSIPATTTVAAYQQKIAAAEGKLHVDTGFWGGVVPGNTAELEPMWRAGVFGFKCFLVPSGVDEFCHVGEEELREAMPVLARLGRTAAGACREPVLFTCAPARIRMRRDRDDDPALARNRSAGAHRASGGDRGAAVDRRGAGCGRADHGRDLSALCVLRSSAPDGPVRETRNLRSARRLSEARLRGALPRIGMVVSDHSPSPPELKAGPYETAWGGIASLELGLSAMATIHDNLADLAQWMCSGPAKLSGSYRKRAASRRATTPTWCSSIPTRAGRSMRKNFISATKSRLTQVASCEAACARLILGGEKIYDDGEFAAPRGHVLQR